MAAPAPAAAKDAGKTEEKKDGADDPPPPVYKPKPKGLGGDLLSMFGFNDSIAPSSMVIPGTDTGPMPAISNEGGGVQPVQRGKRGPRGRKKSRNLVFYYGDSDDYSDDDEVLFVAPAPPTQPPPVPIPIPDATPSKATVQEQAKAQEEAEAKEKDNAIGISAIALAAVDSADDDDDDALEDQEEGDFDEDMEEMTEEEKIAAQAEEERIKNLKLEAIRIKKEVLIERYLKIAKVMITLRKKNIYLQDYLYNLAFRKGVLRGDPNALRPSSGSSLSKRRKEDDIEYMEELQRKKMIKKNALMSARFSRFLRKTGHISEEDQMLGLDKPRGGRATHMDHSTFGGGVDRVNKMRNRLNRGYNITKGANKHRKAGGGKHCVKGAANCTEKEKKPRRRMTIREGQRMEAQKSMKKALETADVALNAFEEHRCKMKKRREIIKIANLLRRLYAGTTLLDQEKPHLVGFVESSVTAQNLTKKKAQRRQKKNMEAVADKKAGLVNMGHQWMKSLERIRELRLKKAKLEKDHRIVIMKKVHVWDTWEKRDLAALESVIEFINTMASRVSLTKREADDYKEGMDQFKKQLLALFENMLITLVRHCKAKSMLHMAQRKVKDNSSVGSTSVKGFSLADFERMSIENKESHEKLVERQLHLMEQYQKLDQYIHKVADGHSKKQVTWSALRAGRHDLKQLWQLCAVERDNLLRKWKEAIKAEQVHRRMYVQVAIVENKKVSLDFLRIQNRVRQLKDAKQELAGKVRHTSSALRIFQIKTTEMQRMLEKERQAAAEKAVSDERDFYKNTIQYRLHPKPPHTTHSVNARKMSSLHRILEPEPDKAIFRIRAPASSPRSSEKKGRIKFKSLAVHI